MGGKSICRSCFQSLTSGPVHCPLEDGIASPSQVPQADTTHNNCLSRGAEEEGHGRGVGKTLFCLRADAHFTHSWWGSLLFVFRLRSFAWGLVDRVSAGFHALTNGFTGGCPLRCPNSSGVAQNETGGANRRFWSMFPLTRVPFWYRFLSHSHSNIIMHHSWPPLHFEGSSSECGGRAGRT